MFSGRMRSHWVFWATSQGLFGDDVVMKGELCLCFGKRWISSFSPCSLDRAKHTQEPLAWAESSDDGQGTRIDHRSTQDPSKKEGYPDAIDSICHRANPSWRTFL